MRIRRVFRSVSTFVGHLFGAVLKAMVTSIAIGAFAVALMHYMGVPVPNPHDLMNGLSNLAKILS